MKLPIVSAYPCGDALLNRASQGCVTTSAAFRCVQTFDQHSGLWVCAPPGTKGACVDKGASLSSLSTHPAEVCLAPACTVHNGSGHVMAGRTVNLIAEPMHSARRPARPPQHAGGQPDLQLEWRRIEPSADPLPVAVHATLPTAWWVPVPTQPAQQGACCPGAIASQAQRPAASSGMVASRLRRPHCNTRTLQRRARWCSGLAGAAVYRPTERCQALLDGR